MSKARKLDTASAVAALLSEGGDRLVVTTEAKYIDVERDHERRGRLKPIKVERRDGTVDEVDVEAVLEGLVRKNQVEALAENLPTCACCGEKVAPVDMRPGRRAHPLCVRCPRCECGRPLNVKTMLPCKVALRKGSRPKCSFCHWVPLDTACIDCGIKRGKDARRGRRCHRCEATSRCRPTPTCPCGRPLSKSVVRPSHIAKLRDGIPRCRRCGHLHRVSHRP